MYERLFKRVEGMHFEIDEGSESDEEQEKDIRKDFIEQRKFEQIYAQATAIWDDFTQGKKKIDETQKD